MTVMELHPVPRDQLPAECADYVRWRATTKASSAAKDALALRRLAVFGAVLDPGRAFYSLLPDLDNEQSSPGAGAQRRDGEH